MSWEVVVRYLRPACARSSTPRQRCAVPEAQHLNLNLGIRRIVQVVCYYYYIYINFLIFMPSTSSLHNKVVIEPYITTVVLKCVKKRVLKCVCTRGKPWPKQMFYLLILGLSELPVALLCLLIGPLALYRLREVIYSIIACNIPVKINK